MSNTVWSFGGVRPYVYPAMHETTVKDLNNGNESRRAELGTYGRYRVRFRVRLPYASETNETFQAFLRARQGANDQFLFKDRKTLLYYKSTLEAVGTGTGSQTAFPLDFKHIDESTLLVYKDAVLQTLTTHYTVGTNNTVPTINFVSAPAGGVVVTATYEFYMPVRFAGDPAQGEWLGGDSNFGTDVVELVEVKAGAHRVSS